MVDLSGVAGQVPSTVVGTGLMARVVKTEDAMDYVSTVKLLIFILLKKPSKPQLNTCLG